LGPAVLGPPKQRSWLARPDRQGSRWNQRWCQGHRKASAELSDVPRNLCGRQPQTTNRKRRDRYIPAFPRVRCVHLAWCAVPPHSYPGRLVLLRLQRGELPCQLLHLTSSAPRFPMRALIGPRAGLLSAEVKKETLIPDLGVFCAFHMPFQRARVPADRPRRVHLDEDVRHRLS
jgi:hypothetical protein